MSGELYRAVVTDLDGNEIRVTIERLAGRLGWHVQVMIPGEYSDVHDDSAGLVHLTPRQTASLITALITANSLCDQARLQDAAPAGGSSSLAPGRFVRDEDMDWYCPECGHYPAYNRCGDTCCAGRS